MLGSFLTGILILALGYAYPAYECFKIVEKNKPDIEQLRFWCKYWILVALFIIFETFADIFVSWLPLYHEAKLALYVYLWYPNTRGTTFIYDKVVEPFLVANEAEIDRTILEFRSRAGDWLTIFLQKSTSYGQARLFEIMNYIASQSQSSRASNKQKPEAPIPPVMASGQRQERDHQLRQRRTRTDEAYEPSTQKADPSEEEEEEEEEQTLSHEPMETSAMSEAIQMSETKLKKKGSAADEVHSVQ